MKQVDIKKIANRAATKAGYYALTTVGYDLANEVVRQRDAQWKRAVKRLKAKQQSVDAIEALDDLIAAMKEGRK